MIGSVVSNRSTTLDFGTHRLVKRKGLHTPFKTNKSWESKTLPHCHYASKHQVSDAVNKVLREFVESIDHRTDSTKLWRTIKGIDGKSKQTAENEGITFTGRSHTSPKLIPPAYNGHRDRLQPAETTSLYSVCGHIPDGCL